VLLGGIILNVQNYPLNTELEIMEKPLDRRDIPVKAGYSSGRFLGIYDGYLDRLIYAPGRLITVGGEFAGSRKEDRLGMTYAYPVIKIQFFRLWPSYEPYYYPSWFLQRGKETEKAPPFWE
jgi:outer membrane lipoprotein